MGGFKYWPVQSLGGGSFAPGIAKENGVRKWPREPTSAGRIMHPTAACPPVYGYWFSEEGTGLCRWTDGSSGGDISQTMYDSETVLHFDVLAAGNYCLLDYTPDNMPAQIVAEARLYHDLIGPVTDPSDFVIRLDYGTTTSCYLRFASDGLFVIDTGSVLREIGTNLVQQDVWQDWKFEINFTTKKITTWRRDAGAWSLKESDGGFDLGGVSIIRLIQWAGGTLRCQTYMDYLRITDNT